MAKRKVKKRIKSAKVRKAAATRRRILKLSEGVLSTVVDVTLLLLFFSAEYGWSGPKAMGKAHEELEEVNYESIKRALGALRRAGMVKLSGRGDKFKARITKQGRKRLEAKIPFYDEKRVWDKKLYLVTYDVAEHKRGDRELLRRYLRKIGCGMLQKSVWLTVYNPTGVLREFIEEKNLVGSVIVSCLGEKGNIGQEDVKDLVRRVFNLDDLNERYLGYLSKYSGGKKFDRMQTVFGFLAVLENDPQLPFELLPNTWVGDEAYELFQDICHV